MNRYEPVNFTYSEFDSPDKPGSGSCIDDKLLIILDVIRLKLGKPVHINSGFRTQLHNDSLPGSSKSSQHLRGKAADLHISDQQEGDKIEAIAKEQGISAVGRYKTFIHLDTRERPEGDERVRYWDQR